MAQQEPNFTQFMFFWQQYNPAYIGRVEDADIRKLQKDWKRRNEHQFANAVVLGRSQWTGSSGAPLSQGFAFTCPFKKGKMIAGITAENSKLGATNFTSAKGNYSYRIDLGKNNSFLSLGVYVGFVQYMVNGSQITLKDDIQTDPSFYSNAKTVVTPDFGAGLSMKVRHLKIGFSIPHLTQSKFDFDKAVYGNENTKQTNGNAKLFRHYFLIAQYSLSPQRHLSIEPSVLIKYVREVPPQVDCNVNWVFHKRFWVGATYSSGNSLSALVGVYIYPGKDKIKHEIIRLGYAYDFSISSLNAGRSSHELMLSFSFRTKNDEKY
jgi:type IX secretion system PorP/SprF family membrane protein